MELTDCCPCCKQTIKIEALCKDGGTKVCAHCDTSHIFNRK